MAEGLEIAVAEASPLGGTLSVLLNRSPQLVAVVPKGFHGEQAVIAERTPTAKVEVEERRVVLVIDVATALGLRTYHSIRGGGNGSAESSVSLDELDADNTLVHLILCDIGKEGVLGIGAFVNHIASDLFGIENRPQSHSALGVVPLLHYKDNTFFRYFVFLGAYFSGIV